MKNIVLGILLLSAAPAFAGHFQCTYCEPYSYSWTTGDGQTINATDYKYEISYVADGGATDSEGVKDGFAFASECDQDRASNPQCK